MQRDDRSAWERYAGQPRMLRRLDELQAGINRLNAVKKAAAQGDAHVPYTIHLVINTKG